VAKLLNSEGQQIARPLCNMMILGKGVQCADLMELALQWDCVSLAHVDRRKEGQVLLSISDKKYFIFREILNVFSYCEKTFHQQRFETGTI
jgi:hypothetical protein